MTFYTDGSAHPNPGPGGYGVIGVEDGKVVFARSRQYGGPVTNNEMELKAILFVMLQYGEKEGAWNQPCEVFSDSSYCVNIFNDWMFTWASKGWIKSDKKTPENLDIIKAYYDRYREGYRIDLKKIKGHAGNKWNELADKLATGNITEEEVMKLYG